MEDTRLEAPTQVGFVIFGRGRPIKWWALGLSLGDADRCRLRWGS